MFGNNDITYDYKLGRLRSKETKSGCLFYVLFPRAIPYKKKATCSICKSKILGNLRQTCALLKSVHIYMIP